MGSWNLMGRCCRKIRERNENRRRIRDILSLQEEIAKQQGYYARFFIWIFMKVKSESANNKGAIKYDISKLPAGIAREIASYI